MSRRARKFLLGVVVLASVVTPAARGQRQTLPAELDDAAWKKVAPEGGGFAVLMPGTAVEENEPVEEKDATLVDRSYTVQTKLSVYTVNYADFPEAITDADIIQRMLDGARDEIIANIKGKFLSEKRIRLGGHEGREWLYVVRDGVYARLRAFWVERRLYQAGVAFPGGPNTPPEVSRICEIANQKFLDSFALTGANAAK